MKYIKKIIRFFRAFGLDFKIILNSFKGVPGFINNYFAIKKQIKNSNNEFLISSLYPCLQDRFNDAGTLPLHYFYLDQYVAKRIFLNNPGKHMDIGSRIDGFVAHLSVFREVEVLDIRPTPFNIPNVKFKTADLMVRENLEADSCESISCLHAIEHFGLGRYGDPINLNGHKEALANISYILKKGGKFYFAVPMGPQRIEFDAHRVFSLPYLLNLFKEEFIIDCFSYIDDSNTFHENVELTEKLVKENANCNYGCAILEMTKK